MSIVILGAGALGSILAAHLALAGEDVTLLARGDRARLLAQRGVRITGLSKLTVPVRIVDQAADIRDAGLLIVTVKTYDTDPALASLKHAHFKCAFSVQNGVIKNDQLAAVFGAQAVLGCAADFSGEVLPDGTVRFTRNEGLYIGELPRGRSDRVEAVATTLNAAGIKTIASPNIQTVEWSKLVGWLSLSPLAALSRLTTHRILQDEDLALLQVTLAREAAQIAGALDIELEDLVAQAPAKSLVALSTDDAVAHQQQAGVAMQAAGLTNHKMSILQDLERGRRLEVEATLGYAVRKAAELGLLVPALDACYRVMAALDRAAR